MVQGLTGVDLSLFRIAIETFPPWFVGVVGAVGVFTALVPGSMMLEPCPIALQSGTALSPCFAALFCAGPASTSAKSALVSGAMMLADNLFPSLPGPIRDLNVGVVALGLNPAAAALVSVLTRGASASLPAPGR